MMIVSREAGLVDQWDFRKIESNDLRVRTIGSVASTIQTRFYLKKYLYDHIVDP